MSKKPTPQSTRLEEVPGRQVTLADGELWFLASPTIRLAPRVHAELDPLGRRVERVGVAAKFGYSREIQVLIDRVRELGESGDVPHQHEAFFALTAALLRRAHNLTLSQACELLEVPLRELPRLVHDVIAVINHRESGAASGGHEEATVHAS